jgi:hypothetical protein
MTAEKVLKLMILLSLFACNSPRETKTNQPCENSKKEFFLSGSWIYQDSAKFELIEIKDTNDVLFYAYTNRKKETGIEDKDWFYKSKAKLIISKPENSMKWSTPIQINSDDQIISIKTDRYRIDYIVKKDTLIEFDKMGIQKRLYRLKSEPR